MHFIYVFLAFFFLTRPYIASKSSVYSKPEVRTFILRFMSLSYSVLAAVVLFR